MRKPPEASSSGGKPRLLDLFCGAGGATRGYQDAGFYVVGVDIAKQPNYCGDEFVRMDALDYVRLLIECETRRDRLGSEFDSIHASPPCQAFTIMQRMRKNADAHPNLIGPVRTLLEATRVPWVIENVEGAASELRNPLLLCGSMFDLDVRRHRLFESNTYLQPPQWGCRHKIWAPHRFPGTINGNGKRPGSSVVNPMASDTTHVQMATAMEIDWMPKGGKRPTDELRESIPPAFTKFIGHQLFAHIQASRSSIVWEATK